MAELTLTQITKQFGNTEVIQAMDIHIQDGEFLVVVGPSGCGKSTLLRMIAGLERVSGGHIRINGQTVNHIEPKDRDIAMVFQNYALYPHMSVFNNMAYGLKLRKLSKGQIRDRVDHAARLLQLEDLLDRKPRELSGGQRQRVAMGRAIVRHPSVFLFDEPLSNLDAKLRTQMRTEIKRLHKKVNTTIIYVTHDQIEAMTLADRIVVLRDGRIEQVGTPMAVFEKPANTFVAGFIGSPPMNLVPAAVVAREGALWLRLGERFQLPVPPRSGARLQEGMAVVAGLRTEDLAPADGSLNLPAEWVVEGMVEVVEPLGGETHLHMDFDGVKLTARSEGSRVVRADERLAVGMNLDRLHLFDARSHQSVY